MSEKKKNPAYVTRTEFTEAITSVKGELKTLKIALVGEDLRGGLVKDVADIKSDLKTLKSKSFSGREKALILCALLGLVGSVISSILLFLKP